MSQEPYVLEEVKTGKLADELMGRIAAASANVCSYCGRAIKSEPYCRMRELHKDGQPEVREALKDLFLHPLAIQEAAKAIAANAVAECGDAGDEP